MWECEWLQMIHTNAQIRNYLNSEFRRPPDHLQQLTKEQIIQAVVDERIFGVVECDIQVPEHLKSKFAEMCPIFKARLGRLYL